MSFLHRARAAAATGLSLRPWALAVVAGAPAALPARPDPEAWRLFLRAERAAEPLRARLRAAEIALPAPLQAVLEEEATHELKRFLSVTAHVHRTARILREAGLPGVVLKGGAAAACGGAPLDVSDLDLLVPSAAAADFAGRLDTSGAYRPRKADPHPTATGKWEMAQRVSEGQVQVEVHFAVPHLGMDPWEGIRPTRHAGLHRLSAEASVWHLLVHSAIHHPERRGQLRELLLLADALAECPDDARASIEGRIAAHAHAGALAAVLAMAAGVAAGRVPQDRFVPVAAVRYALSVWRRPAAMPEATGRAFGAAAVALAADDGTYRELWHGRGASAVLPFGWRGGSALDRAVPPLAWALRVLWRSGNLAAGTVPARALDRVLRDVVGRGA